MRHQPEHNLKALEQIQEVRIWLEPAYLDAGKKCQNPMPETCAKQIRSVGTLRQH